MSRSSHWSSSSSRQATQLLPHSPGKEEQKHSQQQTNRPAPTPLSRRGGARTQSAADKLPSSYPTLKARRSKNTVSSRQAAQLLPHSPGKEEQEHSQQQTSRPAPTPLSRQGGARTQSAADKPPSSYPTLPARRSKNTVSSRQAAQLLPHSPGKEEQEHSQQQTSRPAPTPLSRQGGARTQSAADKPPSSYPTLPARRSENSD